MNEAQIFQSKEFGSVRVLEREDGPWFVGKDVASILGYKNIRDAMKNHTVYIANVSRRGYRWGSGCNHKSCCTESKNFFHECSPPWIEMSFYWQTDIKWTCRFSFRSANDNFLLSD